MAKNKEKSVGYTPKLNHKQVTEEINRVRAEIASDLRQHELMFPKPTEKTLSRVMTE